MARTERLPSTPSAKLLDSLEKRLDLLSRTLDDAEITEKSIDIVREIKELHAILRSLREAPLLAEQAPRRLVVVWGGPGDRGASSDGPGVTSAARRNKNAKSTDR